MGASSSSTRLCFPRCTTYLFFLKKWTYNIKKITITVKKSTKPFHIKHSTDHDKKKKKALC